jgi:2-polyprenyl-3-methyl-5-hydroxy-6-metoxy-1,4-benzoquinol methylase
VSGQERLSQFNRATFAERAFEPNEPRLLKAYELFGEEPDRGRLLDVAAGSGIAGAMLARQGWHVSALDLSEDLLEQIRARGIQDVRLHDLARGPLPYPNSAFRAVFAGEIIEHLVDTDGFLAEVHRVLQPGGIVVLTTPNLASFENRLRLLLGRYPMWLEYDLSDQGHVRAYTVPTLKKHLRIRGFIVERVRGNWVPIVPQRLFTDLVWPPIAKTGDWFPRLSQGLIVKARRPLG